MTDHYVDLPGVRLHCVEEGNGPLVVLLHGFPEAWFSWQHQLPALAAAGYRTVAPDMRGYNLSGKPAGVRSYTVDRLADDVAALIRSCDADRANVAGHDWGGIVAWAVAMRHPDLIERLIILNAPPPYPARLGLRMLRQLWKSKYVFFFQLPHIPEATIRARDYAYLRHIFRHGPVHRDAFSRADIERYVAAASQPGALTAAINYYRAAVRYSQIAAGQRRRVDAPVLVIWGERDAYLSRELAQPDPRYVPDCRVEWVPDASHWVQADAPERVNRLMIDFLAG